MVQVITGPRFLKAAKALSVSHRHFLAALVEKLTIDPFHPQLHTKKLNGPFTGLFSFRLTRDWRVTFEFVDPKTVQLIDVAHRKDIYR